MATVEQLLSTPNLTLPTDPTRANSHVSHQASEKPGFQVISQEPIMPTGNVVDQTSHLDDSRIVAVVHSPGQESVALLFAEILGKPYHKKTRVEDVTAQERGSVVGLSAGNVKSGLPSSNRDLLIAIHIHCVEDGMPPDEQLSSSCDFEFLYTKTPSLRRDLVRFVSFVLGQVSCHAELMAKPRTYFISTTFPDVRPALPNIDILTVGSDAVEIRVDLLREPLANGSFAEIPSLSYVGQQLMLLRQQTELPIIFSTRSTDFSNGKFPMSNPRLYLDYLTRAIQWGVEYIDVELWLPEDIRRTLFQRRGSSRIMSAFHDFTGTFRWLSTQAEDVFRRSLQYADIIKMISIITEHNHNFELEYFRSKMRTEYPNAPPLSAVNMGEVGQLSRTFNNVFTPVTHPLLPIVAAPGQMSTAEINAALATMGQLPKAVILGITGTSYKNFAPQAPFYEKCFNELGLPHQFAVVHRQTQGFAALETWCNQKSFGGAYLEPGCTYAQIVRTSLFFANLEQDSRLLLTDAARATGLVDTIIVKPAALSAASSAPPSMPSSPGHRADRSDHRHHQQGLPQSATLLLDNAGWKGILSTLTRDLAPSAYCSRPAVVLANTSNDAASILLALQVLQVSKIYSIGFRVPTELAQGLPPVEPVTSLESLQRARSGTGDTAPFVIISNLGSAKKNLVSMVVRAFSGNSNEKANDSQSIRPTKRVFLDLADKTQSTQSTQNAQGVVSVKHVAEQSGFAVLDSADVAAFATVQSLRLLVGQNVPYSFVRLANGRSLY